MLEYIPIQKVTIGHKNVKGAWTSGRIQVARVEEDSHTCRVWVHLSTHVQFNGSFDVRYYIEDPNGEYKVYSLKEIEDRDAWTGMFSDANLSTKT